jgi:hypothetical protein
MYSGGYEKFCLLGYNTICSVESQPVFQRNMSHSSSGSKNKPGTDFTLVALFGLFFNPEDGGHRFL